MQEKIISEDEFYERFNRIKNHIDDNAAFDGCMFETFSKEIEYVVEIANKTPKKVWTILDCDGKLCYSSGYYLVNRLGYFITEEEIEDDVEYTVELEDLTSGEVICNSCGHIFELIEGLETCPSCGKNYQN